MSYSIETALKQHGRIMQMSSKFTVEKSMYSVASFINTSQNKIYQSTAQDFKHGPDALKIGVNFIQGKLTYIRKKLLEKVARSSHTDTVLTECWENDAGLSNYLVNQGFITQKSEISTGLGNLSGGSRVIPVNGMGFVHISGDFDGRVEITTPQKSVADVFYTRMFVLAHELGHAEMELVERKFQPSIAVSDNPEENHRAIGVLNHWVFTRAIDGSPPLYNQLGEAYADAFAVLVMKKIAPQSLSVIQNIAKERKKEAVKQRKQGRGHFAYMACHDAIEEAQKIDVSSIPPQEIAKKAIEVASNAWLKSATYGYVNKPPQFDDNGVAKRNFDTPWDVVKEYMKGLTHLNFKRLGGRLLLEYVAGEENEIEKTKALHEKHPAFPIMEKVYDKIIDQIKDFDRTNGMEELEDAIFKGHFWLFNRLIDEVFPAWSNRVMNKNFVQPPPVQQGDLFDITTLRAPPRKKDYDIDWAETLKHNDPALWQSMLDDIQFTLNLNVKNHNAGLHEQVSHLSLSRLKDRFRPTNPTTPSQSPRLG